MSATTDIDGYPKQCERCGQRVLVRQPAAFETTLDTHGRVTRRSVNHLDPGDCETSSSRGNEAGLPRKPPPARHGSKKKSGPYGTGPDP